MPDSPCDFRCGYESNGQDLWNHVFWEHRDCTECPAKASGWQSLTHEPDCPRLRPGYTYPPPEALGA